MDKDEFIEAERRYDEKKRKRFEQEGKESPSGIKRGFGAVSRKLHEDAQPYQRAGHAIKKPFSELKDGLTVRKQAKAIGRFQRHEQALEHADDLRERAEIKRYGRTLSEEEKMRMQNFEDYEERKKRERKERIKARAESFVRGVEAVANADLSGFGSSIGRESMPIAEPNYEGLLYGSGGRPKKKSNAPDPLLTMYGIGVPQTTQSPIVKAERQKPVRYAKLSDEIGSLGHLWTQPKGKKKGKKGANLFSGF